MKNILFICALYILTIGGAFAQTADGDTQTTAPEIVRVEAAPDKGFLYPYYLFVPKSLRGADNQNKTRSLLVLPNNTGKLSDDLAFHEADVKKRIAQNGAVLSEMNLTLLMPVFPRPEKDATVYTHSLDRDVMTTDRKEYKRLDLQLAAMIADAQTRLESEQIKLEKQVLMMGYSASGMFVNRFVFLHPAMVKAAIVGAPGGWAIAPIGTYQKKKLTYPVGTSDLKEISGVKFDLESVRKVPLLMVLGGQDTNDAVPMGDAYDKRESDLVISLFGKTPVERWKYTETLYRENGLNAEFKLYPNATHQMTKEMRDDMIAFIRKHAL
jgi:dienelactone hydrolase